MAVITTNIAATQATYYLNKNNTALTQSLSELSSGSRLAIPSNDAAGLAVSGNLTASISRLNAGVNGVNALVGAAQTLDGFLSTIQTELTRMSELAQEATNGAFGTTDLANYDVEFQNLQSQISAIASNAGFDGTALFTTGSIGVSIDSQGHMDSMALTTVGNATSLGLGTYSVSTTSLATAALTAVNAALTCITTRRAKVNADISKFNFYSQNMQTEATNLTAANSAIADLDVAAASTQVSKYNIMVQSATAALSQANSVQKNVLTLIQNL
ncbi:MAG: flagellin [Verrucomicrobium sp.]|nr:flagellin [Verrucomicrobium sp.]